MNSRVRKILKYLAIGIIAVPLSIVTHEMGHFFAYQMFGASSVRLHSASVSADKEMLSGLQIAITSIVGPIITYLSVGLALFFTRKDYVPFWIVFGLASPFARIVNAIYIYFRLLGYNPNPNFDEYNFSRNVGMDPLILAFPTMIAFAAIVAFFLRKAWHQGKFTEVGAVIFSVVCGLITWSLIGGIILP